MGESDFPTSSFEKDSCPFALFAELFHHPVLPDLSWSFRPAGIKKEFQVGFFF